MTEIREAMQSLYKACNAQHSRKGSCLACPLCDKEATDEEGGFCLANYPCVWDAFNPWLKNGDCAEKCVKKCGDNDNDKC